MYDPLKRPQAAAEVELAPATPRRHLFLVEAADAPDTLAKLLTPFVVAGARLAQVDYRARDGLAAVRLEVAEVDAAAAELIRRRLAGFPIVRQAGLGWRAESRL